MAYTVTFSKKAERQFEDLTPAVRQRLAPKITDLGNNPRPAGVTKLSGEAELYRIRVGDHRIIYAIKDDVLIVLVVAIGDRKLIYRRGLGH